jgi:predicted branched-subunit amino acid permease
MAGTSPAMTMIGWDAAGWLLCSAARLTLVRFAPVMPRHDSHDRWPLALPPLDSTRWQSPVRAFAWGMRSVASTVLTLVLFATYLGIGALAHDTRFSLGWVLASTALVWAGPAQIILISTLGSGATIVQAAIAVTVSAIRLFPMVVSVLPMMRTPQTKRRHLVLVTHFIAVTLWVECVRLLPHVPRERRIVFTLGLGIGLCLVCLSATTLGYGLAANLPPLLGAAILLLTPLAFLLSTARNCRQLSGVVALVLGLALFPLVSLLHTGVDILISGLTAGTIAYGVHWWRERA